MGNGKEEMGNEEWECAEGIPLREDGAHGVSLAPLF
jgi:hypothetical protein